MITTQDGYEVPKNSADFHERAMHFMEIYGDDFFFATGYAKPPVETTEKFSISSSDVAFVLSDKVAYNPKPPEANNPEQQAARASFLTYREQKGENFPAYGDIRGKKENGDGLQLISGGGFMFVAHAFADEPEVRLALFRRTFGQRVLTDANGLVNFPHTAEKETVEEYTPILINAEGNFTVLAVRMGRENMVICDQELVETKKKQEPKILENLALNNQYPSHLDYAIAALDEIPMQQNTIALQDNSGRIIERMVGSVGFEHDNNTWVYRKAGLLTVPNNLRIILVDGEFERSGDYYSREEFSEVVATNDAISSTCAIGREFIKNWPRVSTGKNAVFRLESAPK